MKTKLTIVFVLLIVQVIKAQNYQTVEEVDNVCSQLGFASDEDAQIAVDRILQEIGLPSKGFILKSCPYINNAVAKNIKDNSGRYHRYILYDIDFMNRISSSSNNDWAAISILAHEIGHHLNGHSLNNEGSKHKFELEADYWSGWALAKLGASLEEAQSAINSLRYEKATSTHPAKVDRLKEIEKGWLMGGAKIKKRDNKIVLVNNYEIIIKYILKESDIEIYITTEGSPSIDVDVNQTNAVEELIDRGYGTSNGSICSQLLYDSFSSSFCNQFESKATYHWENGNHIFKIPYDEITVNDKIFLNFSIWDGKRRNYFPFKEKSSFEKTYVLYKNGGNPIINEDSSQNNYYIQKELELIEIRNQAENGDLSAQVKLGDRYYTKINREKRLGVKKRWVQKAIYWYEKANNQGNQEVLERLNELNNLQD